MNEETKEIKKRRLSGKQKTYIAEYIKNGKNGTRAALKAYGKPDKPVSYNTAHSISSENLQKPAIQEAIDQALIKLEATPEFAVNKVLSVASMELDGKTAPSVLRASEKLLELHGWRKDERPTMTLNVKNAFFNRPRRDSTIIDQ